MKIQNRGLLLILIVLAVVTATIGMVDAIPGCSGHIQNKIETW